MFLEEKAGPQFWNGVKAQALASVGKVWEEKKRASLCGGWGLGVLLWAVGLCREVPETPEV